MLRLRWLRFVRLLWICVRRRWEVRCVFLVLYRRSSWLLLLLLLIRRIYVKSTFWSVLSTLVVAFVVLSRIVAVVLVGLLQIGGNRLGVNGLRRLWCVWLRCLRDEWGAGNGLLTGGTFEDGTRSTQTTLIGLNVSSVFLVGSEQGTKTTASCFFLVFGTTGSDGL